MKASTYGMVRLTSSHGKGVVGLRRERRPDQRRKERKGCGM